MCYSDPQQLLHLLLLWGPKLGKGVQLLTIVYYFKLENIYLIYKKLKADVPHLKYSA